MDVLFPIFVIVGFVFLVLHIVFLISVFRYFRDVPSYIKSIALSLCDIADRQVNDDDDIDDEL